MQDEIRFLAQNVGWASLNAKQAYQAQKAMRKYKAQNPNCEISGTDKNVQVHHIIPVWQDPYLADDPNNFISLSSSAHLHLIFGHNGNFGGKYVKNVREIAKKIKKTIDENPPIVVSRQMSLKKYGFWDSLVSFFRD
jgi:hypothetical protein